MPLTEHAKSVIARPLPKANIKQRPGKGGMTFDYVTPAFVIGLLNEAFEYRWSTRILSHEMIKDTALVRLELSVTGEDGARVAKEQFGSCDVSRGMGPGEAFKGAASDALKKAATLLGVALELYNEEVPELTFRAPAVVSVPSRAPVPQPAVPSMPPQPVAAPVASSRPVSTPPSMATGTPAFATAVSAPVAPPRPVNPFAGNSATLPSAQVAAPAPPAPPKPVGIPVPKVNPFASKMSAEGPNATQLSALTNLASRREKTPADLIASAGVVDGVGTFKQSFDELTHSEAIEVIKASQGPN